MLGKLFGFKKKSAAVIAEMSKHVNRDAVQAAVYGCFYIASIDGDLDESEIKKTERLINNEPLCKGFGAELHNLIDAAETSFTEGGPRIIRQRAKKELEDLAHDKVSADIVMNIIATVADEGGIGEEEKAGLALCAQWMNLNIKDYL